MNTPPATLGRLFCLSISAIWRSRRRATSGANKSFELAAADHDAVESQRTSMQRYNCSLKSSFIELPAGGARIKPAFPLFQTANGVQIYLGKQCILLQAWPPASPSIRYT